MIKKIFLLLLLLLPIVYAQDTTVSESTAGETGDIFAISPYDNDGDGVCNDPISQYRQNEISLIGIGCTATTLGDRCSGTLEGETVYRSGDRSGCSDRQLAGLSNYWSIKQGDPRPLNVKANWLTDQIQGITVYQPIEIVKNSEFLRDNEEVINYRDINVLCDSGRGVIRTQRFVDTTDFSISTEGSQDRGSLSFDNERRGVEYYGEGFGRVSVDYGTNRSDLNEDLEIRLFYQRDESVVRPKDIRNSNGEFGIDEIEFNCVATISQCRQMVVEGVVEDRCTPISPPETDNFRVIVNIDSVALQSPEFVLDAGIKTADEIIDFTDKLEPKLRTLYGWMRTGCVGAIGIVLTGKTLSFIPGANEFADLIWYGPKGLRSWGLYSDKEDDNKKSFLISGRSFCASVACPRDWCRPLNYHSGGTGKSLAELTTNIIDGKEYSNPIQNSLVLSSVCGCVSGMLAKLYEIEAIALNWRTCLLRAKTSGEFIGQCDKYLKEGICTFVIEEISTFDNFDLSGVLGTFSRRVGDLVSNAVPEALQARGLLTEATKGVRDNSASARNFAMEELGPIGSAGARGILGYEDHQVARTLCSLAIYKRLPDFSSLGAYDLEKISIESTTSANWDLRTAYAGESGRPVYSYSISWMVVSGRENLRYNVYLESDSGARRNIHDDLLTNVGDFDSDFIEITDEIEYTNLCFDLRQEARRIRCFPPGRGSQGGLIEESGLFSDNYPDRDNDRLKDSWESKYNCYNGRTDFVTTQDKNDCDELLAKGKENKLDPDNKNSNGDRRSIEDGSEDPDGDGYNNYQEYKRGGNPLFAENKLAEEGSTLDVCDAEFSNLKLIGGEDLELNAFDKKYIPGETLRATLEGLDLSGNDVDVSFEISGPGSFFRPVSFKGNDFENGAVVDVFNFDSSSPNGNYEVLVKLTTLTTLGGRNSCRNSEGEISEQFKFIVVYNSNEVSCEDSDRSVNFDVGGYCADSNSFIEDGCNGEKGVSDFYCNQNSCQSQTSDCEDGKVCRKGACVLEGT